ncbi:MAG: hypothetical protein BECKG1743D_GA0114223_111341 [Candidatus Kentron sp. G]|nr:MAG: hypothetical protein BECKG1743F_GA0114225_111161 [Candidatus Kentron sp. G]VFN07184.1 MAG: hypothetical protein BECKG1743E_GA0114224_111521 [Candidatus Kentron sp. G]VFN07720.1 MAG: hypothetical protein BECKG1743D_GA0114223_111341 [Candidatus Kentron sp. G]
MSIRMFERLHLYALRPSRLAGPARRRDGAQITTSVTIAKRRLTEMADKVIAGKEYTGLLVFIVRLVRCTAVTSWLCACRAP